MLDTHGNMVRKGSPDPSDAYVIPELTDMSVGFMQDDTSFAHAKMFPSLNVKLQQGKYPIYPRGYFWRDDMEKRGDGAVTPEGGFAIKYADLACDVWGWKTKIGPQLRANAGQHNLDEAAAMLCANKAMINREVQFMSAFFTTGKWSTELVGDATGDESVDLSWADADANIIAQVDALHLAMKRKVGGKYKANKGLIGAELWSVVKNHPSIIAKISGGATTSNPAVATLQQVAALFSLEELIIADAIKTTSTEKNDDGDGDTFDFIGADDAFMMVYTTPTPGLLTPSAGYTFEWDGYTGAGENGVRMKSWFDIETGSTKFEVEQAYDLRVVVADCGIFLSNMLDE